jgi:hypothetical protein
LLLSLAWAGQGPAYGQIFQLEGGTSSLYEAHGGSLAFRARNYDGWVGVGSLDGWRAGAFLRTQVRNSTLTFGDDVIPFRLPTDIFDSSHYLMGRGVGLARSWGTTKVFGFAGATSVGMGTPFFRAAEAQRGVGLLFLERRVTPGLSIFSRNVFSSRQSSINGLDWQIRPGLHGAMAGGLGSGRGYWASSLTYDREWLTVKAAYIRADERFRRITVQQPLSSEVDRENILVTVRPKPYVSLTAGRQNFLQPLSGGAGAIRGSVNQYLATLAVARFNLGAALFESQVLGARSTGASFSAGRKLFDRVQVNGNWLWNRPAHGRVLTSLLATFREVISPRLSLLQLVNNSQGRTSVSYGGEFVSNRVTVGVEYQTLYVPFLAGGQFKQALVLNFHLRPFGNYQFNAGSFVAPDGTVRYTAYGGTFLYHGKLGSTNAPSAVTLYKYIMRGRVVDEEGRAVRGAALRVDGELVFSDSSGDFFVRKKHAATYALEVLPEQFLVPGRYEVVSAPAEVVTVPDEAAREVTIVVRRVAPSAR